jgi:hypothetical protein
VSTAEQYHAFACECMRWAERAQDDEHRETLLDMATRWAQAAALVDHLHTLMGTKKALFVDLARAKGEGE